MEVIMEISSERDSLWQGVICNKYGFYCDVKRFLEIWEAMEVEGISAFSENLSLAVENGKSKILGK